MLLLVLAVVAVVVLVVAVLLPHQASMHSLHFIHQQLVHQLLWEYQLVDYQRVHRLSRSLLPSAPSFLVHPWPTHPVVGAVQVQLAVQVRILVQQQPLLHQRHLRLSSHRPLHHRFRLHLLLQLLQLHLRALLTRSSLLHLQHAVLFVCGTTATAITHPLHPSLYHSVAKYVALTT